MKRSLILSFSIIMLCIVFSASVMDDNGRAGYVGSPGEVTCNTSSCHNAFALNSGGGSITATCTMVNWKYDPLTTYYISIKVAKSSVHLFGFAAEILTSSNANAGTIIVSDPTHTQIKTRTVSGVSRRNIVHKLNAGSSQDSAIFTFSWTSPDTTTGPITMYFCGNASNASGTPAGDYIYSASQLITPSSGDGVQDLKSTDAFSVYPNPATENISLHYFLPKNESVVVRLFDNNGRSFLLMNSYRSAGENNDLLSIPPDCATGLYILAIESASGISTRKLMIK